MESPRNKKVVLAMSGGIDSSVAATLLKKDGYNVVGLFLKLYNSPRFKEGEKQAKKIAKILGISFLILDLRKEFKKKIINYFLKGYKTGFTPNPCIVCNKEIKFKTLFKKAQTLKADYLATGHYIRKQKIENRNQKIGYKLLMAKDREKDQSYFLWQLSQKELKKALFPLGNLTKKQVKNLAKKFKLPVLGIAESQEICFIKSTINNFLKSHLEQRAGRIIDKWGNAIGQHQGLVFYTIGQRKGIGLPGGPYFVLSKDLKRNLLVVTQNEKDLLKKELIAKEINWISGRNPKLPLKIKAKIRYRSVLSSARIKPSRKAAIRVIFDKPQRAITPGQSVVFYLPVRQADQGEELLGGGIIS